MHTIIEEGDGLEENRLVGIVMNGRRTIQFTAYGIRRAAAEKLYSCKP
jgi:hypothetical protein